jgi:prolycopene isomerase
MAGLVAGNGLVKRGYRVLMLEKHAAPGGCTMNFKRGDFRFEASNHVINGCEPGGMTYQQLAKIDAQDRVEFIKLDSFGRMVDEERGTEFDLPWELGAHVEMLVQRFPREEEGIRSFYAKYGKMAETLLAGYGEKVQDDPELLARLTTAGQDYMALSGRKAVEVLAEHVSDPHLIETILEIPSGFMGTSYHVLDAGSAVMCDLIFRINGGEAYYPKGGSGHMAQALADLFVENGGRLLLNRGVTEIVFSNGRAAGIIAKKSANRFISAQARCIIAACDLTALVNHLCPVETFPVDYVKSINERVPGISAVILFAGLDIDVRQHGITGGEISRSWATAESPSPFEKIAREGDYSKLPSAMATIYSNIDPSCCPEGKSVVATMVLAEPERFERALGPGRQRGRAYKELKKHLTAQLLEKMERALGIPDLESHVEVLELATPITIERYTENRGGSYVGWK